MKRIVKVGAFVLGNEEENAIKDVMNEWKNGGRLCDGKKQNEFEKEFAKYIGTKHSIVTSSGTTALITGLTALRHFRKEVKKENKKIITTPLTYIATTNTIVVTGYEPIFVDIDPDTFVITPENIKKALEEGTRQVALYAKKLDNRYGNLRLKKFVAAALGFERVCFKKVD